MEPLVGPGGRYRARLELLQEAGAESLIRKRTSEGRPQGDDWLVVFDEAATARLTLGEGGITLHSLGLAMDGRAILQAEIEAGAAAPDWMPADGTVHLFSGDRQEAAAVRDQFVPLPGAAAAPPEAGAPSPTLLDQLFLAVGRSVSRANQVLVGVQSPGGTAVITNVTVSVALNSLAVERGRVVVKPADGDQSVPAGPSVQFTLAVAPSSAADTSTDEVSTSVSPAAPASSQPMSALPSRRK